MKDLYKNIPDSPGVYLMKNKGGELLYVGKAVNLRRRVSSYFLRPHDARIQKLVSEIRKIDYLKTDTAIEALILEAELIKKYEPPFNIKDKDGKSFLYVEITRDEFPRVLLVRGKTNLGKSDFPRLMGPFTSASSIREALRIIRKIFSYSTHSAHEIERSKQPRQKTDHLGGQACFNYQIGLCSGTCISAISKKNYAKIIKNIKLFFNGKKKQILKNLEKEMGIASKSKMYEKAAKLKRQIFALQHINDVALITDNQQPITNNGKRKFFRIEGYDISNISGSAAVGVMVVFSARGGSALGGEDFQPDKNEYRKFKIKTVFGPDDTGMMREVLTRRFGNSWRNPDLILIDGGRAQVNVAESVLKDLKIKIPVVGIAKGPERKRNDFIHEIPKGVDEKVLIRVRDEAHRFAISYHRKVRAKNFL